MGSRGYLIGERWGVRGVLCCGQGTSSHSSSSLGGTCVVTASETSKNKLVILYVDIS